jgi:hypothetical protein
MSTPPRDAGIPMLTEVIEEEGMDFVGPPPPDEEAAASPMPIAAAGESAPELAAPELQPAPSRTNNGYAPQVIGIQYGPPAQFAPSYPLPLKPAAPSTPVPAPSPAVVESPPQPAAVNAPLPAPMSEDEWQRMERRVRERILGQLLSRTDAMLEERIRSSVAGVLEQAVDGLAATLRASLHKTLEDVVSRAVAQEISRLQSPKK